MSSRSSRSPSSPRYPPLRLSLAIWALAAAFYLFGFFQRVTPASLAGDLMREFQLTGAALGNLSAFYFYAYAAMQIPTGVLVDRIGPTRLILVGTAAAGAGALLFALAPTVTLAAAGRALIGAAHGIAWVSMLKLVSHWFPASRFGTMSGISLAVGTFGAVLAGPPLRALADGFGWRTVIAVSGVVALLLALVIWRVMRDDPAHVPGPASGQGYASYSPPSTVARGHFMHDLGEVLSYRNTWCIVAANSGVCGGFLAFTGLWGVPYFVQVHGLSVREAATVTSAMLVMFALGGPVFGALSDRVKRRKAPYVVGAAIMLSGFALLAAPIALPLPVLVAVLVVAGFGAGSMGVSFGFAKESVPAHLQGTVTGVVNAGVMLGALSLMPAIGLMLDAGWQGQSENGVRVYPAEAFRNAWMLLAGWIAVAFAALLMTRERRAQPTVPVNAG